MSKVRGIKSVDFKVIAKGHGVVNWNGSIEMVNDKGKILKNHMVPKLRGFTNLTGKVKEDTGHKYRKHAQDIDFNENPLYISQNCIRHHLFKDQNYDLHFSTPKNLIEIVSSVTGLLRGFVIPSAQYKKTSPLLLEDFVDQLGNGNYEQFATDMPNEKVEGEEGEEDAYKRPANSIYSKTTFGDTEYLAYGSISIEEIQFISLDPKFDRCAMPIKNNQGEEVAERVTAFLESLAESEDLKPKAVFHENYVRLGSIFDEGEVGLLLNDDAIEVLVAEMLRRVSELGIKQAKGYMYVEDVIVDYNGSHKAMRIKRDEQDIVEVRDGDYATYFEGR